MLNLTMLLVVVIAVSSALAQTSTRRPQMIRFFTTVDCRPSGTPPYYNFTDQTNINLVNSALQSYCVIQGAWRVELNDDPQQFNISVGDACTICHRRPTSSTARFGFIRRIGGADITQAWISLYKDGNFNGEEKVVSGWEYNFDTTYSFTSMAFTSFGNWTWQLYYSPRFRGDSVCLRPNYSSEITLMRQQTVNVGSIRLGCRNSGTSLGHRTIGVIVVAFYIIASFK